MSFCEAVKIGKQFVIYKEIYRERHDKFKETGAALMEGRGVYHEIILIYQLSWQCELATV